MCHRWLTKAKAKDQPDRRARNAADAWRYERGKKSKSGNEVQSQTGGLGVDQSSLGAVAWRGPDGLVRRACDERGLLEDCLVSTESFTGFVSLLLVPSDGFPERWVTYRRNASKHADWWWP